MKIYLVGGAVRDEIMGLGDSDKDWVVVGATPEDLIFEGYTPVGKDFPVFLHPQTGEEYALARTERKTAPGYHGFVFHADPNITLEEDLARRDLTINAIAKDIDGKFIDPFKGIEDIKNKIFRHVSSAYKEDPVRILRLSRFAARYPDFSIAPETQLLLKQMCENGEVDALVKERVWQELSKGLLTKSPYRMFEVLLSCGAFSKLFPNIDATKLTPSYLPKVERALTKAAVCNASLPERFAVLNFMWPVASVLKAPKECLDLGELLISAQPLITSAFDLNARELLQFLHLCDALRRPDRFIELLNASECLSEFEELNTKLNATLGNSEPIPQLKSKRSLKTYLIDMQQKALSIDHREVATLAIREGRVAEQIGEAIDQARVRVLEQALSQFHTSNQQIN